MSTFAMSPPPPTDLAKSYIAANIARRLYIARRIPDAARRLLIFLSRRCSGCLRARLGIGFLFDLKCVFFLSSTEVIEGHAAGEFAQARGYGGIDSFGSRVYT